MERRVQRTSSSSSSSSSSSLSHPHYPRASLSSQGLQHPPRPPLQHHQFEYRQFEYRERSAADDDSTATPSSRTRLEILNGTSTFSSPSSNTATTAQWSMFNLLVDNLLPAPVRGGLRWMAAGPRQALISTLEDMGRDTTQTTTTALETPPLPRRRNHHVDDAIPAVSEVIEMEEVEDDGDVTPRTADPATPNRGLIMGVVSRVSSVANTVRSVAGGSVYLDDCRQAKGNTTRFDDRPYQQQRPNPRGLTQADGGRTTQDDSERLMYINGALHILRGLPQDLSPSEVAMLQRAMPPALVMSSSHQIPYHGPPGAATASPSQPGFEQHQQDQQQQQQPRKNLVQILVFALLCWLWSIAERIIPWATAAGRRAAQAEHQHGYIPRLVEALSMLLLALVEVSRRVCECRLFEGVVAAATYAARGTTAAVVEFAEGKARQGAVAGGLREVVERYGYGG